MMSSPYSLPSVEAETRRLTTEAFDTRPEREVEFENEEIIAATPALLVVRLPANYERLCTGAIAELDAHLASDDGAAARQTICPLIDMIVVQPGDGRVAASALI